MVEEQLVDLYYEVEGVPARCKSGIKVSEIPAHLIELFRNISEFYDSPEEILRSVKIVEHQAPMSKKVELATAL